MIINSGMKVALVILAAALPVLGSCDREARTSSVGKPIEKVTPDCKTTLLNFVDRMRTSRQISVGVQISGDLRYMDQILETYSGFAAFGLVHGQELVLHYNLGVLSESGKLLRSIDRTVNYRKGFLTFSNNGQLVRQVGGVAWDDIMSSYAEEFHIERMDALEDVIIWALDRASLDEYGVADVRGASDLAANEGGGVLHCECVFAAQSPRVQHLLDFDATGALCTRELRIGSDEQGNANDVSKSKLREIATFRDWKFSSDARQ